MAHLTITKGVLRFRLALRETMAGCQPSIFDGAKIGPRDFVPTREKDGGVVMSYSFGCRKPDQATVLMMLPITPFGLTGGAVAAAASTTASASRWDNAGAPLAKEHGTPRLLRGSPRSDSDRVTPRQISFAQEKIASISDDASFTSSKFNVASICSRCSSMHAAALAPSCASIASIKSLCS